MSLSITILFLFIPSCFIFLILLNKAKSLDLTAKLFLSCFAGTIIVPCALYGAYHVLATTDIEYLGGYAKEAIYYEDWDEEVSCTHTRYCTKTDSNGRSESYSCGNEHLYDVDYHPEKWVLVDSNEKEFDISKQEYENFVIRWKNKSFRNLNRYYHLNDGNAYITKWNGLADDLEPTTVSHFYTNKIPASDSIFKKSEVSEVDKRRCLLYDYPKIYNYKQLAILGGDASDSRYFELINSLNGRSKQVRIYVFIFKNKNSDCGFLQENYLEGGNKNEVLIMLGMNNSELAWHHVACYDNEELKTSLKFYLNSRKTLDIKEFAKYTEGEIVTKWRRKEFTPLNKSISIVYPFSVSVIAIVLDLVIKLLILTKLFSFSLERGKFDKLTVLNLRGFRR